MGGCCQGMNDSGSLGVWEFGSERRRIRRGRAVLAPIAPPTPYRAHERSMGRRPWLDIVSLHFIETPTGHLLHNIHTPLREKTGILPLDS